LLGSGHIVIILIIISVSLVTIPVFAQESKIIIQGDSNPIIGTIAGFSVEFEGKIFNKGKFTYSVYEKADKTYKSDITQYMDEKNPTTIISIPISYSMYKEDLVYVFEISHGSKIEKFEFTPKKAPLPVPPTKQIDGMGVLKDKLLLWMESGFISEIEYRNALIFLMNKGVLDENTGELFLIMENAVTDKAIIQSLINEHHQPLNECINEVRKSSGSIAEQRSCLKRIIFDPTNPPYQNPDIPQDWREWCNYAAYENESFCTAEGQYQQWVFEHCRERYPHLWAIYQSPPGGFEGDVCFDWVLGKLYGDWYDADLSFP